MNARTANTGSHRLLRGAGAVLLLLIAVIHLTIVQVGLHLQPYLGVLFLLDGLLALLSAAGIGLWNARRAWLLGALVAAGSFAGYVVTRTVGLPGLPRLHWQAPNGLLSLVVEALVVVLALWALNRSSGGREA